MKTAFLILMMVTAQGKEIVVEHYTMPNLQSCLDKAKEFEEFIVPDSMKADGIVALKGRCKEVE